MNSREKTAIAFENFLGKFVLWAETQDDIRSALILGSRARTDQMGDEFSDLDLSVFVQDPQVYLESTGWLEEIGKPWINFLAKTSDGQHWMQRCLFPGGLDVDFAFVPATLVIEMLENRVSQGVTDVFNRGYRILFDKDQLLGQLAFADLSYKAVEQFDDKDFQEAVSDFWYHAVWTAKLLRRRDLWRAKQCCDCHLKRLLLRVLEWHAQSTSLGEKASRQTGRYPEEWADPRALLALKTTFASYDLEDTWRALLETMELFEWLVIEIKNARNLSYPGEGIKNSNEYIKQLYNQRT